MCCSDCSDSVYMRVCIQEDGDSVYMTVCIQGDGDVSIQSETHYY